MRSLEFLALLSNKSNDVEVNRSAEVGQDERAAGVTQMDGPSIELPAPRVPVAPSTVIVKDSPTFLLVTVEEIAVTLLAAALIVWATFRNV